MAGGESRGERWGWERRQELALQGEADEGSGEPLKSFEQERRIGFPLQRGLLGAGWEGRCGENHGLSGCSGHRSGI